MRVLHIGFGYTPFRAGGLIEYAEDLMAAQVANGDTVAYFTAGRRYLWFRQPRLWRWKRGGVQMFELINSPLVLDEFGSKDPALDMQEPYSERFLREVITQFKPDVIHIQELASLPSSVLELVHEAGIPNVMTLQDYLPLCPTFRLYDYLGKVCLQRDVGQKCVPCCATLAGNPRHIMNMTGNYDLTRFLPRRIASLLWRAKVVLRPITRTLHKRLSRPRGAAAPQADDTSVAGDAALLFQQRRQLALSRLDKVDALVAQSHRVAEIYRALGVTSDRLRTLHLTVNHLRTVSFRARTAVATPLTFVTMNGCATIEKGALLLTKAVEILIERLPPNSFRLLIFGGIMADARVLLHHREVEYRGFYRSEELDHILNEADVGIVPSIWEEAYGYTGVEMLAKGVPVIGNSIGGIVDYVKPGVTGWLNLGNTIEGLAAIMREIIEQPEQIVALNRTIAENRAGLIKTMELHRGEIEQVYAEAGRRHGARLAAA